MGVPVVVAAVDGDELDRCAGVDERVVEAFGLVEGDGLVECAVDDQDRWRTGVGVGGRAGESHQVFAFGDSSAE